MNALRRTVCIFALLTLARRELSKWKSGLSSKVVEVLIGVKSVRRRFNYLDQFKVKKPESGGGIL
jgi:hypothetical protein